MELLLSEPQSLLRDAAAKLGAARGGPRRARKLRDAGIGIDQDAWREMVQAGWPCIMLDERHGGSELGALDLALLAEEAGKQLLMTPLVEAASAAWLLGKAGMATVGWVEPFAKPITEHPRELMGFASAQPILRLLQDIAAGTKLMVPATSSPDWQYRDGAPAPHFDPGTATLSGAAPLAPYADAADLLLVDAAAGGETVLCLVPRSADGVVLATTTNVDGSRWSHVSFRGVQVPAENVVAQGNAVGAPVSRMQALLVLGTAAELIGVTQAALDITLDYLKVRQQFGKPIGSFQALQHRIVNCTVDLELNRSLIYRVLAAFDAAAGHPAMIAAAKARVSRCALEAVRAALQLHGAIGYTDEHDIGLYYKRAVALAAKYGNEIMHMDRFSALTLPIPSGAG